MEVTAESNEALVRCYVRSIPQDCHEAARRFPERHWHLLKFLSRIPQVLPLPEESPTLGFALANAWEFTGGSREVHFDRVKPLLDLRRRKNWGALGFEASEASAKAPR